jgi:hypothetical protein
MKRSASGALPAGAWARSTWPAQPGAAAEVLRTATLDPYAVSGQVSMALFEELVATASIVGQP